MIDLLVVSQSCLMAINRSPYREMARRGWQVELVIPDAFKAGGFARAAEADHPDDPPIHRRRILGEHPRLWTYEGLREVLESRRPRFILLDVDPGSRLTLEVGWWARRRGAHVLCISCDNMRRTLRGELARSPGAAARFATARSLQLAARLVVDHVFALSSEGAALMAELGYRGRVSVMPLGFDPAVFHPDRGAREDVRRALGLRHTTFAYFGRLIPEKGVHLLLQALAGLKNEPWHLLLDEFGDYPHPYALELRRLIDELALGDRVVFFDAAHDEIARYMNAVDVVVVPSVTTSTWKEQYGRVVPEAMACGKLVVTSDSGALPEVAGGAGIVVPENDVDALRGTLQRLIHEPDRIAGAETRAVAHATAQHSLKAQCDRMEAVMTRGLAPRRTTPHDDARVPRSTPTLQD